jgi:hypothetical protein
VAAREKCFEVSTGDVAYVNTLNAHVDMGESWSLFVWVRPNIAIRVLGYLQIDPIESDEKVIRRPDLLEASRLWTASKNGTGL